jgi:hypothetical protein
MTIFDCKSLIQNDFKNIVELAGNATPSPTLATSTNHICQSCHFYFIVYWRE